jgi:pimeloyl-ACP methyl ester carboxylesterase
VGRVLVLAVLLTLAVGACTTSLAGGSSDQSGNAHASSHAYACSHGACSGLVAIGNQRKLYLECRGTGSPTVVFIAGRTDRGAIWQTPQRPGEHAPLVLPSVATFTRACVYDRPGTVTIDGSHVEPTSSTPVSQPTTASSGVADLHALLVAAKVPGPYLVVAHSYGGLIGRLFASSYPKDVTGLVLVDTLTELMYPALGSTANQLLWLRLNNNYSVDLDRFHQERTDLLASFMQMEQAPPVRPMPVLVLSSDQPYDFAALVREGILPSDTPPSFGDTVWHAVLVGQQDLAGLLHAQQIMDTYSGHYIHLTQPQLVINSIRHVYDQIAQVADPPGLTLTASPKFPWLRSSTRRSWSLRSDSNRRPAHYETSHWILAPSRLIPVIPLCPGQNADERGSWHGAEPSGTTWDPIVGMELGCIQPVWR